MGAGWGSFCSLGIGSIAVQTSGGHQFKSDPRRMLWARSITNTLVAIKNNSGNVGENPTEPINRGRNVAWQASGLWKPVIAGSNYNELLSEESGLYVQVEATDQKYNSLYENPVDPTVLTITQKLRGKLLKHLYYLGPVTQFGRVSLLQSGGRGFKSRLCP